MAACFKALLSDPYVWKSLVQLFFSSLCNSSAHLCVTPFLTFVQLFCSPLCNSFSHLYATLFLTFVQLFCLLGVQRLNQIWNWRVKSATCGLIISFNSLGFIKWITNWTDEEVIDSFIKWLIVDACILPETKWSHKSCNTVIYFCCFMLDMTCMLAYL